MSSDFMNKMRLQKKFKNLKAIQKLLENSTQFEEYITGQTSTVDSSGEIISTKRLIRVDSDLHYLFETDPTNNATRVTELRSGDLQLTATIEDNFYYQHMFNFALVVILLLQVIVVWAFIWCRLAKYGNQPINQSPVEDVIAMRDVDLPEVIPHHINYRDENSDDESEAEGVIVVENRCGRYG